MYIKIDGHALEVELFDNSSSQALVNLLKEGDITYTADDYGNFEKVGEIGHALPRNDEPIETKAGDVILYQGNKLCIYYAKNNWNFTRIGRVKDVDALLKVLKEGGVIVTLSLKNT